MYIFCFVHYLVQIREKHAILFIRFKFQICFNFVFLKLVAVGCKINLILLY
jgi:hypothetical protein